MLIADPTGLGQGQETKALASALGHLYRWPVESYGLTGISADVHLPENMTTECVRGRSSLVTMLVSSDQYVDCQFWNFTKSCWPRSSYGHQLSKRITRAEIHANLKNSLQKESLLWFLTDIDQCLTACLPKCTLFKVSVYFCSTLLCFS